MTTVPVSRDKAKTALTCTCATAAGVSLACSFSNHRAALLIGRLAQTTLAFSLAARVVVEGNEKSSQTIHLPVPAFVQSTVARALFFRAALEERRRAANQPTTPVPQSTTTTSTTTAATTTTTATATTSTTTAATTTTTATATTTPTAAAPASTSPQTSATTATNTQTKEHKAKQKKALGAKLVEAFGEKILTTLLPKSSRTARPPAASSAHQSPQTRKEEAAQIQKATAASLQAQERIRCSRDSVVHGTISQHNVNNGSTACMAIATHALTTLPFDVQPIEPDLIDQVVRDGVKRYDTILDKLGSNPKMLTWEECQQGFPNLDGQKVDINVSPYENSFSIPLYALGTKARNSGQTEIAVLIMAPQAYGIAITPKPNGAFVVQFFDSHGSIDFDNERDTTKPRPAAVVTFGSIALFAAYLRNKKLFKLDAHPEENACELIILGASQSSSAPPPPSTTTTTTTTAPLSTTTPASVPTPPSTPTAASSTAAPAETQTALTTTTVSTTTTAQATATATQTATTTATTAASSTAAPADAATPARPQPRPVNEQALAVARQNAADNMTRVATYRQSLHDNSMSAEEKEALLHALPGLKEKVRTLIVKARALGAEQPDFHPGLIAYGEELERIMQQLNELEPLLTPAQPAPTPAAATVPTATTTAATTTPVSTTTPAPVPQPSSSTTTTTTSAAPTTVTAPLPAPSGPSVWRLLVNVVKGTPQTGPTVRNPGLN